MPNDSEMVTLIKDAAQEGQFDKMSVEEIEKIYNYGLALLKDSPYDEELIKAVNKFETEIQKRKINTFTIRKIDKKEMTEKSNQPFIQCLALFAVIYFALLFLVGLARTLFSFEYNLNTGILFFTAIITSTFLAKKVHRTLTKIEIVILSIGAFAIILLINIGAVFFLKRNLEFTLSQISCLSLIINFLFIFAFFGYFPDKYFKYIEANEKKISDKSKIRKRRVTYLVLFSIAAVMFFAAFFCNFLLNPEYNLITVFIIIISTITSTLYLNSYLSKKLEDPEHQSTMNPSFKKRWVRISCSGLLTLILSFSLFGGTLPWFYTYIVGSEGEIRVKVTGWRSGGHGCSRPYVDHQILFSPSRGLCVDKADQPKYPEGTTLRLKGKISALGINISQMEKELLGTHKE
ncbi:MAG: hypothetical protein NTW65_13095 [Deltaproteobacteria bacterium]|nr:hypothetical protein [Deltaproteobacteria bacterium]